MKKFEYISFNKKLTDSDLNDLGKGGWQLVSHTAAVAYGQFGQYYVFMREILTSQL